MRGGHVRAGLGYGVSHGTASSRIERNLLDFNRHSIAGTGAPGCGYEARRNWLPRHATPKAAVRASDPTVVRDNAYGSDPPAVIE